MIERLTAWSRSCLTMQGYGSLSDSERKSLWLGLRFAPALCFAGIANAEFREGRIEQPPVDHGSVDCVISNGVINLSPDKPAVFAAAAAALRPGGRLAIADIVSATQLPEGVTCDASLWAACIGGAVRRDRYLEAIELAGFEIAEVRENDYRFVSDRADNATRKYGVTSISLLARRREER